MEDDKRLRAGAGKARIEFADGFFPQESFDRVHDGLHARVIILEQGQRTAIVSMEMTSLPADEIAGLKALLGRLVDASADHIWICVTHTFSSPHFLPPFMLQDAAAAVKMDSLRASAHAAVSAAAESALQAMRPAVIEIAEAQCDINVNRDVETAAGWWLGSNPKGMSDKTLTVLKIRDEAAHEADAPMALMFHYGVQPSVMDGATIRNGQKEVTSDLAGRASAEIESVYGDKTVAMFMLGAAGDQAPTKKSCTYSLDGAGLLRVNDLGEAGYMFVEDLGQKLARAVLGAVQTTSRLDMDAVRHGKREFSCPGQKIPAGTAALHPTRAYAYEPESDRDAAVEAVSIGNLILVGTKAELNAVTAKRIKAGSEFDYTLILTLVNGGAKYMADSSAYERCTYEAMNSGFAKGAAEILEDQALQLAKAMKMQMQEVIELW